MICCAIIIPNSTKCERLLNCFNSFTPIFIDFHFPPGIACNLDGWRVKKKNNKRACTTKSTLGQRIVPFNTIKWLNLRWIDRPHFTCFESYNHLLSCENSNTKSNILHNLHDKSGQWSLYYGAAHLLFFFYPFLHTSQFNILSKR